MLGRPYFISGHVVHGRKLGRTLGFPTLNLRLPFANPALDGIFVVQVHGVADRPWPAVASLGRRPAVEQDGKLLLEAQPARDDRVLVVEGGTGYLAELLRPLVASLATIPAAEAATASGAGDYTLIVVDGAIEQLPESLAARLAEDGRIVSGLVLRQVTRLAAGRKVAGKVTLQPVEDLGIPVLHAFDVPKGWTFA